MDCPSIIEFLYRGFLNFIFRNYEPCFLYYHNFTEVKYNKVDIYTGLSLFSNFGNCRLKPEFL